MYCKPCTAMEKMTVHQASYRPLTVSPQRTRSQPALVKSNVPVETVTVHQDTYWPRDARNPIKSKPPRDHPFLSGDCKDRFRCTTYKTDYPAKSGRPGKRLMFLYGIRSLFCIMSVVNYRW